MLLADAATAKLTHMVATSNECKLMKGSTRFVHSYLHKAMRGNITGLYLAMLFKAVCFIWVNPYNTKITIIKPSS